MHIGSIRMVAANTVHSFDKSKAPLALEYLKIEAKIEVNQILFAIDGCLYKPSVISTWFLKQATHIFAGFDIISVPHSQHNLSIS